MNKLAVVLGVLLGLGVASSCRLDGVHQRRRLTGTCEGACDHYLACKRSDSAVMRTACVDECGEVLQDPESLRAFESLECQDTIEYVEGSSGRGPGQMVGEQKE